MSFLIITNRLQQAFDTEKSFADIFNKLTFFFSSILSKAIVILIFQLDEYVHVSQNSHLKKFNNHIKESIQLIVINRLRSTIVRSINKNIKDDIYSLSFYFSNWLLNRVIFRRVIQRFNKNIVDYRDSFVSFNQLKSQSSNFDDNSSSFELFVFKANRIRRQSSIFELKLQSTFISIIVTSNSFSYSFVVFRRKRSSLTSLTSNFFVFRTFSIFIFSIEFITDIDDNQQNFFHFSNEQIDTRQSINHQ